MKKIIFSTAKIVACMATFVAIFTFLIWSSHCIADAFVNLVGSEKVSYLYRTAIFFVIQAAISGAIFILYKKSSFFQLKIYSRPLNFFSNEASASNFILAILPVIAFPFICIVFALVSRNDIEINSVMRWQLLPISLAIIISAAAIEEFLFRGVLLRLMLQHSNLSTPACIFFQSIVFALFHGEAARSHYPIFIDLLFVGLFLGLAYRASHRLWVAILLHSWSNIWSGLLTGGSKVWFAGPLLNIGVNEFVVVKRCAIVVSILLLLRLLRNASLVSSNIKSTS
ncbi:CPBP family intramembrane glutamic endopeptidase [Paucibacter sp. KCTC 42545]|uniref:CPBP family intramembrane glutamic endopeptidase n=1 Tax=Paucibacter sp. KCTC 42545 TaxID=1768242 RepID=UPI0018D26C89|nr:CPBP family intramembrane glutamic endopeptidase [Paucibacter sp. KCTC 42545]